MINKEIDVGIRFRYHTYIVTQGVFIRIAAKGNSLVYADVPDTEFPRFFNIRNAAIFIAQVEAFPAGTVLCITFLCRYFPFLSQFIHQFQVTWLIRVAAAMQ